MHKSQCSAFAPYGLCGLMLQFITVVPSCLFWEEGLAGFTALDAPGGPRTVCVQYWWEWGSCEQDREGKACPA